MKNLFRTNINGYTLTEVAVVTGILGILGMGSMSIMRQNAEAQKSMAESHIADSVTQELNIALSNESICTNFLGPYPAGGFSRGTNVPASESTPGPSEVLIDVAVDRVVRTANGATIQYADDETVVAGAKIVQQGRIRVDAFKLGPWSANNPLDEEDDLIRLNIWMKPNTDKNHTEINTIYQRQLWLKAEVRNNRIQRCVSVSSDLSIAKWTYISMFHTTSYGIYKDQLYGWGNSASRAFAPVQLVSTNVPIHIGAIYGGDFRAYDFMHSTYRWSWEVNCSVTNRKLFCWGSRFPVADPFRGNPFGAGPGIVPPDPAQITSAEVPAGPLSNNWEFVSVGGFGGNQKIACGIHSGSLYCWGDDTSGAMGNGPVRTDRHRPSLVAAGTYTHVAIGTTSACAIDPGLAGQTLQCWGTETSGELANGGADNDIAESPIQVGPAGTWTYLTANLGTFCGIMANQLYCWGNNFLGRVGDGTNVDKLTPTLINQGSAAEVLNSWNSVTIGSMHSCGITSAQDLYCWGSDPNEQLGNGPGISNQTRPQLIDVSDTAEPLRGKWTQVSAGSNHTCGIFDDRLYCWGTNGSGELGNGNSPVTAVRPSYIPPPQ